MRKPFFISLGAHIFLFLLLYIASAVSAPMKPPEKVYSVRILAAPRPRPNATVRDDSNQQKNNSQMQLQQTKSDKGKPKPDTQKPKPASQKNASQKAVAQGTASIQIEGSNFSDDFYLNLVITKIANNWLNPLRGGRKLAVIVYFRIQRSGEVTDAAVKQKSGNPVFDQSALRAALAAAPLPPLPDDYTGDFLGVNFEFEHTGQ
jgi:protein TonB